MMEKIEKKERKEMTQMKKCQISCFILFHLNNKIKLNSIHFNRLFRLFETIESIENTLFFCFKNLSFFYHIQLSHLIISKIKQVNQ